MPRLTKALFGFLVATELAGIAFIAVEVFILMGESSDGSYHWLGYTGAFIMTASAFLYNKVYQRVKSG